MWGVNYVDRLDQRILPDKILPDGDGKELLRLSSDFGHGDQVPGILGHHLPPRLVTAEGDMVEPRLLVRFLEQVEQGLVVLIRADKPKDQPPLPRAQHAPRTLYATTAHLRTEPFTTLFVDITQP